MSAPSHESATPQRKPPTNAALIRRMLALGWRYRRGCLHVLLQQGALVILGLVALGLTGLGIDFLAHHVDPAAPSPKWPLGIRPPLDWHPLAALGAIAGVILALAVVQSWLRYRAAVAVARLTQRIVVTLRTDVYDKLQRLSFRFFDRHESGSIINRVTGDVQAVRMFVDGVIIQVTVVALSLAVYLAYMLSVHVWLTLAVLASTPLLWIITIRFARKMRPTYLQNRELSDKLVLTLSENVQGAHVVKGFALEQAEIDKFVAANRRIQSGKKTVFRALSIFQPVVGLLTQVNMLVLVGLGGWLVIRGELLLGEGLFVFANLLQQFANQIGQIANISNSIQASLTGAERVFEVLDAPVEISSPDEPVRLEEPRGSLEFADVAFGYDPQRPVLADISLRIEPGECIAIVGATGAGKSTLLNLIPRFYDPTGGVVRLDGVDLRELDLHQLRRCVGLVFQESFLFSHTVAANIAFGRPDATPADIERAALAASAHDFIMELPDGYNTVVGEYGSNLSGGQRQRLAIARAILLDPTVLILDDATTAIDPGTEHFILDALDRVMEHRTTLVVAHRLSTLRRADRVVVLEAGRIVAVGTHDELMERSGHYRESAVLQMRQTTRAPGPRREVA